MARKTRARETDLPDFLSNSSIAELLAVAGERAKPPLQRAFRRASRRAFLWPEEAYEIAGQKRSLTELTAVGPYIEKVILQWLDDPPTMAARPEIRNGFFTWMEARTILEKQPSWKEAVKGDLQMHTVWSDGTGSVKEMSDEAAERGYEFIAVTDHSKGLKIAGGINEEQLEQQAREIEAVNERMRAKGRTFRVLRSIELNLNPRGEGDMEIESLARLDLVLGCFHSSLRKKDDQTERYLAGLRNPGIQILGHPRGRIYNFRTGLYADWARVFGVAAEIDKAVEIDSYPDRQDLSNDLVALAKKAGCRISIGTDAHGPSQMAFIDFGLASALKAGISRERILNFMSAEEIRAWAASVRARRSKKYRTLA